MADMKKTILKLLIVAVAIMATCCKNHSDANFTVTGEIENVEDNYLILLFKSNVDDSTTHIAEDTLRNGCFEFTAPAETGVQYHIFAPHTGVFPSMSVDFYVEPGAEIKITGKDYLTKNWTVKSDVRNQKTYQSYFGEVAGLFKELQILELQCRKEGRSIDYLDLSKPYQEKIDSIEVVWLRNQKRISEPWMDMMLQSIKFSKFYKKTERLDDLMEIWNGVDDEYKITPKGKNISSILCPNDGPFMIGDKLPYETKMYDLDGRLRSLSEFKDKVLLLYFSSNSCKPCVEAKKELDRIISSGKSPINVIGFNLDAESVWKSKGKENPVPWHDFNELKGSYGFNTRFETKGIPTFVIVSKDGKILDIWAGYRNGIITERIESALSSK